jgi:glutamate-1-semialdehyde 2,1-aminomutase
MIARAYKNRKRLMFVNGFYHGVAPWCQKVDYPGVIVEDVCNNLYVDFNNDAQVEEYVKKYKGEIAAFIATPYMHGNFVDNVLPEKGYWQKIRKICTENDIILIVDDVRCGFRLDIAGSDHFYGFEADLICFCKALANGWNVSSLCGKDFLKPVASSIMFTGSYWMSAVPFAAGIACINKMKKTNATAFFREQGLKLTNGLKDVAKSNGFNLSVSGEPALFYLINKDENNTLSLHQEWVAECVKRGVFFTNHHNHFINLSLTDEDIKFTLDVADEAYKVVKSKHPEIK